MEHIPLFGDMIAAHEGLAEELKSVDVAADLTLLLHHAGKTRADLARTLGWSRARVTQVLSGDGNLTVQTIAAVAQALGYTFDAVFRKTGAQAASQPWEQQITLQFEMSDEPDLQSWMSRKTMKPMQIQFEGAREFMRFDMQLDSSNHESMYEEVACAA